MSSRIPRTNSSHEEMEINEPSIPIPQAIYTAQIMLHYPPMPHHMLYHQQQQQQQHLQQQNHHLHHQQQQQQQQQHHHIHQQQHLQHQQQLQHQQHHQQQLHHQQLQQHQQMIHHLQQSQQLPTASLPALITPTTTPTASGSNPSEDSGDGGGQVIATSVSNDDGEDVGGGDQNHLGRNGDHDPYKSSSYHTDSMKPTHRCTQLTLQQKVEVLQMIDQKIPYREIAKQYNIAHSTISGIKKTKQEIYSLVQKRANLSMHRIHKSMPITSKILDERMYAWYVSNRNQNVLINGRQLQQKALEIAKELSLPDFKASNGWLDSFKRRHQILLKHHTDL